MTKKMINKRYEIIRKLGSGGMADVYLALDTVLNREVAIKILREDLNNNPVALLRFKREANAGSGLNHPNVVEIYDVGEDDNVQYIVMEYIKGSTAKELSFRRGSLDLEEAIDFMLQLSYGISKAHAQGIVHRDIKPQNILVTPDGTIKVSDFGIAQAGDALQLTKADSVMGSVHYLAPELVRGEKASYQSDIYAMGIIFYEMLVGEPPFDGEMPVEIAMKQLKDATPNVQKFNSTIPNSVVNIINRATAKNTLNRYVNVDEMIRDLKTALSEERADEEIWEPAYESDENTKTFDSLDGFDLDEDKEKDDKAKKSRNIKIGLAALALTVIVVLGIVFGNNTKLYKLEDLSGLTLEEAQEILDEYNITISKSIEHDFSTEHEEDTIIKTKPRHGTEIEHGSQISVTLSLGDFFEVGDYVGEDIEVIKTLLYNNTNINIRTIYEYQKDKKPGTILEQQGITPGTKVSPTQNLEMVLKVAKELEIQIPNINNADINDAKTQLENQGINVKIASLDMSGMDEVQVSQLKFGVVIKTNPMMGSTYIQTDDSFVTLYYYDKDEAPKFPEQKPVEDVVEDNSNDNNIEGDD